MTTQNEKRRTDQGQRLIERCLIIPNQQLWCRGCALLTKDVVESLEDYVGYAKTNPTFGVMGDDDVFGRGRSNNLADR